LDTIAIGTVAPAAEVRERLAAAFRPLREAGVQVRIEEQSRGSLTFLGCSFEGAGPRADLGSLSRQTVADAVAEFITSRWQERLLRRLLSTRYSYFNEEEQVSISAAAARQLARDGHARPVRKGRILARLQEYLEKHNTLVVDGFVTFRCKDYVEELEAALDQAVDEFLLEREYQEFVRLLRYFVESQPARHGVVHAFLQGDGSFQLADQAGRPLNNDALADLAAELAARDVAMEDLLISALISLAPRSVVLHRGGGAPSPETLSTVEAVFGPRLAFCPGCPRCPPG
jgi:putative sporulation protein YtxC